MGVLAEYLKTEAVNLRSEGDERQRDVLEWQQGMDRLYETLSTWIAMADGGLGLLRSATRPQDEYLMEEPRLGTYWAKKFTITLGDPDAGTPASIAEVVPRGRYAVATLRPAGRAVRAADGVMEVREGRGRKLASHYLFRWKNPDGDEWFICSDAVWNARNEGNVESLTPESFEAALLSAVR